ncbi:hypothetical protein QBC43DRAFT_317354 [Cladorrhinum sp. PSN259]|nr:hypothetical protein QBC43DRAFT_317354 [Cladorrhinum sp. PSN259]
MDSLPAVAPFSSSQSSIADTNATTPDSTRQINSPSALPFGPAHNGLKPATTQQYPVISAKNDSRNVKYSYSKLPPRNIRLLHLLPHEGDGDPIRCQLFEYPFQDRWERRDLYEALSYCWGAPDKPFSIYIGQHYLPVTASLHAALLRLRHPLIGRILWIDAVCINQEDKVEQAQQVRFMAEIYFKAGRVIIWLGECQDKDRDTLRAICDAGNRDRSEKSSSNELSEAAVLAFLDLPWFRRIWVLQEVAAARHVRVMCGPLEVEGYAFCLGLEARPDLSNPIRPMAYLMKQTIFRPQYGIGASGDFSLNLRPLRELIDMYHNHEASWSHDKVFALLGMSSDDRSEIEAAGLLPDYEISWEKLLKQLVRFILGEQVSVYTWSNQRIAVMKGKGYILGKVSKVEEQLVQITHNGLRCPREWALQPSAKTVNENDLICLLDGAPASIIIRPRKDYFSVIVMATPIIDNTAMEDQTESRERMVSSLLAQSFVLVWSMEDSETNLFNEQEYQSVIKIVGYEQLDEDDGVHLAQAIRLRKAASILQGAELHDAARLRFQEMMESCKNGVSALYDHMMADIQERQTPDSGYCNSVLLAVLLARRPLSVSELSAAAGLPPNINTITILEFCGFCYVTTDGTVDFIHQTANDYLKKNIALELHPAGAARARADIGNRLIDEMSLLLRQNMYNLDPGSELDYITTPRPDPLAAIKYACMFWADHFSFLDGVNAKGLNGLTDRGRVFEFLKKHFLHWLEALSLMRKLSDAVCSIRKLLHAAQTQPNATRELGRFLQDAERFVLHHSLIMAQAPLQIYGTALLFSPLLSVIREGQWGNRLSYLHSIKGIGNNWGAQQQTLEGHTGMIVSIAFSPDGKMIASGSWDKTVRLWNTATGVCDYILEGHTDRIYSIAFSPDGKTIASGSFDETVRLWNSTTGVCEYMLKGHTASIESIAFSLDGKMVASGSPDKTVRLWNTATGVCDYILQGHISEIQGIAFSPDGKIIASGSWDKTVRLWNTATGVCDYILEGHTDRIYSIAFSPDGKMIASGSRDRTVRLWRPPTSKSSDNSDFPQALCPRHLKINKGFVKVISSGVASSCASDVSNASDATTHQKPVKDDVFHVNKDNWVTRNSKRLLWLPPGYREYKIQEGVDTIVLEINNV